MTKTYFTTASAYMHQNLFQPTETADLLVATIVRNRDKGEFLLHEFVIMPNRIHLLLSPEPCCSCAPQCDSDHTVG
jgi:putative transposase